MIHCKLAMIFLPCRLALFNRKIEFFVLFMLLILTVLLCSHLYSRVFRADYAVNPYCAALLLPL